MFVSTASAEHSVIELVGGTHIAWVSEDCSRVLFYAQEPLASEDTDASQDLYERSGGKTMLVSIGPAGGNGPFPARFAGASADGSRVFLCTEESLVSEDTDDADGLYERSGGTTTLIWAGPNGSCGPAAVSEDGTRVFFQTQNNLVGEDTDNDDDIYERSEGATTFISTGPDDHSGPWTSRANGVLAWGVSPDGSHVFFATRASLVREDEDPSRVDIYERLGDQTLLASTGPSGGNGNIDALFRGVASSHVFFLTEERLVGEDTDDRSDVYEYSDGQTTLVSTGPSGGNGPHAAVFRGASKDGTRVFFVTGESLVAGDTDGARDLYERAGGETTLVSIGPNGGNGGFSADNFFGASADGSRVFFCTQESLVSEDTDSNTDIYERADGTTTLISVGPDGGNGPLDVLCPGSLSEEGARVFFATKESLVSADTDSFVDVYERAGGTTTLISVGPAGGNGPYDALFASGSGASADGSHVFVATQESLVAADTDADWDIYVARIADDTTPPIVTVTTDVDDTADPATSWYTHASSGEDGVAVEAGASDPSGVASLACTDGETTAWNDAQSSGSFTVGDGIHSVACSATDMRGNAGAGPGSTPMPVLLQIDQTPPTLTCPWTAPNLLLQGAGGEVEAEVTDATSGSAQAAISAAADVSSAGRYSVSLTGWDLAGNEATTSCDYLVGYRFLGFFSPLHRAAYEAGATVPLRFALANASGIRIPDGEAASLAASCAVRITFAGAAHRCASYDAASDTFHYNLKTSWTLSPGSYTISTRVYVGPDLVTTKDAQLPIRR